MKNSLRNDANVIVCDNPLVEHNLSVIRNKDTSSPGNDRRHSSDPAYESSRRCSCNTSQLGDHKPALRRLHRSESI